MTAGRNDPCPCGSGVKFKRCCGAPGKQSGWAADLRAAFEHHANEGAPKTPAELQQLAARMMQTRNAQALADFEGLSPEQMHRLLHFPFTSPNLLRFEPPPTELARQTPVMHYLLGIAEAADGAGLKATATGNLPRNFSRDLIRARIGEGGYAELTRFSDIQSEADYIPLHATRIVAEAAGILRLTSGRFRLVQKNRIWFDDPGRLYLRLLETYTTRYNWAYADRFAELPILQQAFAFGLYLLHRHGAEERPEGFYGDAFVRAFPTAGNAVKSTYRPPEELVATVFETRMLHRFGVDFGLVECFDRPVPEETRFRKTRSRYRRGPLLGPVVRFS